MKKKFLLVSVMLLALLVGLMTACGSKESSNDNKDSITMGIAIADVGQDGYNTLFANSIKEAAEKEGIKIDVLDAQADAVKQANQIEDLMQKQVDVIMVWPVNAKAIVPVVKKAHEKGFPILSVNSIIDESGIDYINGYTGPDDFEQGRLAGELMVEALNGEGKVVEIIGTPGADNTNLRVEGFHEAIKDSDIEVIDSQPSDWDLEKSQQIMENFLTKYDDIDGIYAMSDNVGTGAYNAIKEAGREGEIAITSANMYDSGYELIEKGEYYGSVEQSPIEDAKLAVKTAIDIVNGEEIEFKNFIDTPKVTQENIEEFDKPGF